MSKALFEAVHELTNISNAKYPSGLPVKECSHVEFVKGDVIQDGEGNILELTDSIASMVNNSKEPLGGQVLHFTYRHYSKIKPKVTDRFVAFSNSGEYYSERNTRFYIHDYEDAYTSNPNAETVIFCWKPHLNTLYNNFLYRELTAARNEITKAVASLNIYQEKKDKLEEWEYTHSKEDEDVLETRIKNLEMGLLG